MQEEPSWYWPHWQIGLSTADVLQAYPTGHGMAAMLPAGAKKLPVTATGAPVVVAQVLPAGQVRQVVCLAVFWYSPGMHGILRIFGSGHMKPTGQSVQLPSPEK